jgi:hypothetical protein
MRHVMGACVRMRTKVETFQSFMYQIQLIDTIKRRIDWGIRPM